MSGLLYSTQMGGAQVATGGGDFVTHRASRTARNFSLEYDPARSLPSRLPRRPPTTRRRLPRGLHRLVHVEAPQLGAAVVLLRGGDLHERVLRTAPVRTHPLGPVAARAHLRGAPQIVE